MSVIHRRPLPDAVLQWNLGYLPDLWHEIVSSSIPLYVQVALYGYGTYCLQRYRYASLTWPTLITNHKSSKLPNHRSSIDVNSMGAPNTIPSDFDSFSLLQPPSPPASSPNSTLLREKGMIYLPEGYIIWNAEYSSPAYFTRFACQLIQKFRTFSIDAASARHLINYSIPIPNFLIF